MPNQSTIEQTGLNHDQFNILCEMVTEVVYVALQVRGVIPEEGVLDAAMLNESPDGAYLAYIPGYKGEHYDA